MQVNQFLAWAEARGVSAELMELDGSEAESLRMLSKGEMDAFVTLDTYGDPDVAVPLWKIGSSDFYFAVSKGRPDLLQDLNTALNRIHEENRNYGNEIHQNSVSARDWFQKLVTEEESE